MQHARPTRLRRAAVSAALAILLGVASLTLTQCRMVGEKLTGVGLFRGRPTTCIKQCNDRFKILFDEEHKRHDTNVEACQALPQPDRAACLAAEEARHTAEMASLGQAKIDCQNGCHRQGTGSSG